MCTVQEPQGSTYCQCLGQGLDLPLDSDFSIHSDSYITLIVTVANGITLLYNDIHLLDLTFMAEGGDCQVKVLLQLYVLDDL